MSSGMSRTAIITGASTGIGRQLAKIMAREGYDLGLTARRLELLEEIRKEILARYPERRVFVSASDVTRYEESRQVIGNLAEKLGSLALFVANAGVGANTPAWEDHWKEIKQVLEVNVLGAIAGIEAARDIMLAQGFGHIVGISSVAGARGLPTSSAYSTSKVALTAYLESIRIDLKPYNIAVTSIHPGFIATPLTAKNKVMPFLLSAEKACEMIYSVIKAKKSRYVLPWQWRPIYWITRRLPDSVYDFIMGLRRNNKVFE